MFQFSSIGVDQSWQIYVKIPIRSENIDKMQTEFLRNEMHDPLPVSFSAIMWT